MDDQTTLHFPWGLLRSHSTFWACYFVCSVWVFFPHCKSSLKTKKNSIWECFPDFFVKITGVLVDLSGDGRFWQFYFQVLLLVRQKKGYVHDETSLFTYYVHPGEIKQLLLFQEFTAVCLFSSSAEINPHYLWIENDGTFLSYVNKSPFSCGLWASTPCAGSPLPASHHCCFVLPELSPS